MTPTPSDAARESPLPALSRRMALGRFVVLGRVGMDLYADPPGAKIETAARFVSAIGGSAGNIAVALARQGLSAALLSCVSEDPVGRFCLEGLTGYGVDTRFIRRVTGGARTSLAVTETVAEGCQTVLYRNNAADFALSPDDVAGVDFTDSAALVVTGTALAAEPSRGAAHLAMERARIAGALVILDIDYRAYSWTSAVEAAATCRVAAAASDVVIGNDVEFGLLAGGMEKGEGFARKLAETSAVFTCFKRGEAGCTTFTEAYRFDTPIFPVKALKPTGAGDGFMGGLLAGLTRGETLDHAVRRGAATAALIVSGIGCAPASPTQATLDAFLAAP